MSRRSKASVLSRDGSRPAGGGRLQPAAGSLRASRDSLDQALDALVRVIEQIENIDGLLVGLEATVFTLAEVDDSDEPEVRAAKQWAPLWLALHGVVEAVRTRSEVAR